MPDVCNNTKAFVHKPDPLNALERKHSTQKRKQRKQESRTCILDMTGNLSWQKE
jgi:hypothetical protein